MAEQLQQLLGDIAQQLLPLINELYWERHGGARPGYTWEPEPIKEESRG